MKKILHLHIGNHKTGTSSIQRAMRARVMELEREGISYFSRYLNRRNRKSINRWITLQGSGSNLCGVIRPGLVRRLASVRSDRVVASAESFSWLFSQEDIELFSRELSSYFEEVKIICYIRRQDRQLLSLHQQGATGSNTDIARFFGSESTALPAHQPYFDHYLDYSDRLGKWADAFGDKNILIRVYEEDKLYRGDAVADFFHVIGADTPPPEMFVNESRGLEKAKVGHLINQLGLDHREELRRFVLHCLSDSSEKMLPARAEAEAFYEHYRQSNIRLNERFHIGDTPALFDDDFSVYPEEANELWTEKSANLAIGELLQALAALPVSERSFRALAKARQKQLEPK